jgi:hypothetical protein
MLSMVSALGEHRDEHGTSEQLSTETDRLISDLSNYTTHNYYSLLSHSRD